MKTITICDMSLTSVIITGGTRGLGLGLARRFLEKGCSVTLCGTTARGVNKALGELEAFSGRVYGVEADVRKRADVELLLDTAVRNAGRADIWVNNAGISHETAKIWELDGEVIGNVLQVNMVGVVNGTVVPFLAMQKQGSGKIFNMEGLGSDGFIIDGMSVYGTSKSALCYFTRAFAHEANVSPVQIGSLSPGMVVTDLLLETLGDDSPESKKKRSFYNIMADDIETVSAFLCDKMLASTAHSPRIQWLTKPKILSRMLFAPFMKRDFFA